MRTEWIIDVLADLKAFAEHNEMAATAAGLEDAMLVALAEMASQGRRHGRSRAVVEAEVLQPGYAGAGGNVTNLFAFRA